MSLRFLASKESFLYGVFGAFVIFLSLYPFWIFADYSALGFYDEVDGQIPWNFLLHQLVSGTSYVHAWAGGVPTNLGLGGEEISFYRLLTSFMDVWVANLLFKFLGLFAFFAGLYSLLRVLTPISGGGAFALGLFAVFTSYISYGWAIGGHGWDLAVVVWLSLIVVAGIRSEDSYFGWFPFVVIAIAVIVSSPIFSLPMTGYFFIFLLVLFPSLRSRSVQRINFIVVLSVVVVMLFVLNWHNLYQVSIGAKSFSARLLSTLSPDNDNFSLFHMIAAQSRGLINFLWLFSNKYLYVLFILFFVLSVLKRSYRSIILFIVIALIIPLIVEVVFDVLNLPILSSYRWEVLMYLIPIMLVISFAVLLSECKQGNLFVWSGEKSLDWQLAIKVVSVGVMILVALAINVLASRAIDGMHVKSGNGLTFHYEKLHGFDKNEKQSYRVVSDYKTVQWALPLYYGFHTYDGLQPAFTNRRSYFNAYGLFVPSKSYYPANKHFFYFYTNAFYLNRKLLEMVGVKYIFSARKSLFDVGSPSFSMPGLRLKDLKDTSWYWKVISYIFGDQTILLRSLKVFKLDSSWARVFSATKIVNSSSSFKEKSFYKELKGITYNGVQVAKEDHSENFFLGRVLPDISSYKLTKTGADISLSPGNGAVVFNEVYLPGWIATCHEKQLQIVPVNGVMMAVKVNSNCQHLKFTYVSK